MCLQQVRLYCLADHWLPPALKLMSCDRTCCPAAHPAGVPVHQVDQAITVTVTVTVAVCPICSPEPYLAQSKLLLAHFEMRAMFCSYAGVTHACTIGSNPEVVRFTPAAQDLLRKRPKVREASSITGWEGHSGCAEAHGRALGVPEVEVGVRVLGRWSLGRPKAQGS